MGQLLKTSLLGVGNVSRSHPLEASDKKDKDVEAVRGIFRCRGLGGDWCVEFVLSRLLVQHLFCVYLCSHVFMSP